MPPPGVCHRRAVWLVCDMPAHQCRRQLLAPPRQTRPLACRLARSRPRPVRRWPSPLSATRRRVRRQHPIIPVAVRARRWHQGGDTFDQRAAAAPHESTWPPLRPLRPAAALAAPAPARHAAASTQPPSPPVACPGPCSPPPAQLTPPRPPLQPPAAPFADRPACAFRPFDRRRRRALSITFHGSARSPASGRHTSGRPSDRSRTQAGCAPPNAAVRHPARSSLARCW